MPLAEKLWSEHMNKLIEREAFIDSIKIQCAELRNIILFDVYGFLCFLGVGIYTLVRRRDIFGFS